jgi:hypothetical protein
MKKSLLLALTLLVSGCDNSQPSSDQKQSHEQERILQEGTAQTGMPSIKNFRERKILKHILELRDQSGLVTYTYVFSDHLGKFIYIGESIGYGISAATQYTNPQKRVHEYAEHDYVINQADPNGLFSPSSAEGTWVLLKNPSSSDVVPTYFEQRINVVPFKLPNKIVLE